MPLTTLSDDAKAVFVMVAVDPVWILSCRVGGGSGCGQQPLGGEGSRRIVDTVELRIGRQASERGDEVRMPDAREMY
jgi:hypothetical protein